jgi:hypothetical protein
MAKNAIDIIQPTLEKVKGLLLPFDAVKWMKLALVVLIAGASSGGGQYVGNMGNLGDWDDLGDDMSPEEVEAAILGFLTDEVILAITIIIALLILFFIFWNYISSVFTFVFFESVVTKEVKIREGFKRNMKNGLSLFVFRVAAILGFLLILALMAGLFIFLVFGGGVGLLLGIVLGILFFIILIPLIIAFSIIISMAEDFAVPIMSLRGDGILKSMRHSIGLFKKEILQFALYYVMKLALGMAASVISIILLIPVFIVMGIMIAIIVVIGALAGISLSWSAPLVAIAIVGVAIVMLLFIYLSVLITLPIPVFFRYYSLMFLRERDAGLDLEKGLP